MPIIEDLLYEAIYVYLYVRVENWILNCLICLHNNNNFIIHFIRSCYSPFEFHKKKNKKASFQFSARQALKAIKEREKKKRELFLFLAFALGEIILLSQLWSFKILNVQWRRSSVNCDCTICTLRIQLIKMCYISRFLILGSFYLTSKEIQLKMEYWKIQNIYFMLFEYFLLWICKIKDIANFFSTVNEIPGRALGV